MSASPKVLLTINTSWNIYNFRASLIRALQAAGYEVITAAPEDVYTPRLMEMVRRHVRLPMSNAGTSPVQDVLLFCRYLRLMRKLKPDVVLSYTIKPNIYGSFAAGVLGIPIIANISGLGTAFIRDNWLTKTVKVLYRAALRFSSHVFFQNPEDRDLFIEMGLVEASKTVLLPGSGVDLAYFQPGEMASEGHPSFLLIARMLWDKGIAEFVDAARIVKAQLPEARFRLVGPTGVENKTSIPRQAIDAWVAEGVVEYLGESDDVREIIRAHDCVVLPSYREGMSRVLLEASAMGKPMIVTNVPGCKHVVDHGRNGLLCNLRDASDLAEKMLEFTGYSAERRAQMGRESRDRAEREFDEKHVIGIYLKAVAALVRR